MTRNNDLHKVKAFVPHSKVSLTNSGASGIFPVDVALRNRAVAVQRVTVLI